jgi:hypothetical protein
MPVSPAVLMVVRLVDVLAIMGLVTSLVLGLWWAWRERETLSPPLLAAAQFAALGLFLGRAKHLDDALYYSRPVSPLLLFIMLRGITTGPRWVVAVPLPMSLNVGFYFVKPALNIVSKLLTSGF